MRHLRALLRVPPLIVPPVAVAVVLAVVASSGGGGSGVASDVARVSLLALSAYAAACSAVAARSARGRERGSWVLITAALAVWTFGSAIWAHYAFVRHSSAIPVLPAYGYFVVLMLTGVALLIFPARSARHARLRLVLDGVGVALCLFLLLWFVSLHTVYDSYRALHHVPVRALLFPVADMVLTTIAVLVLVRADARHRPVLWPLVVAILLVTVTHSAYVYLLVTGGFKRGGVVDVGWAAALIAFIVAALVSRRAPPPQRRFRSAPTMSTLWLPYVPLLLVGTIGPAMVLTGLERILVPVLMVVVCFRQMVAAWENQRLLAAAADRALRDPLTGLANRTLFDDRLARAMMLRQRGGSPVVVVSLDLDDFKLVNDTLGHQAADAILIRIGERISGCLRPGDTVARLGGDEFAVLLEGRADHSHLVAEQVVEAFAEPFMIDGESVPMRLSVGMAVASPAEPNLMPDVLVKRADIAMYTAKRSRSGGLHTFSPEMTFPEPDLTDSVVSQVHGSGAAQVRLLGELREAVNQSSLELVYQPKIDLRTTRIVGVEALVRWPHPELGVLRPQAFMSLVRRHGLMRSITDLVLDKALDDAVRWVSQGAPMPVAVNMFAPFLRDAQLPDALRSALDQRNLPPDMLTVEVTEDLVLDDVPRVTAVLHRLREHGIRVAIDDFGSGFSALAYLRDLSIDEIKLDRQFIASVTDEARGAVVVRAVIDLIHDLGLTVVAEGIEDAGTADWLREHGCDIGQGYYFGKPMAASAIAGLIRPGYVFDAGTIVR
ncbi:EAL domain-containing protein [soil metagenome]